MSCHLHPMGTFGADRALLFQPICNGLILGHAAGLFATQRQCRTSSRSEEIGSGRNSTPKATRSYDLTHPPGGQPTSNPPQFDGVWEYAQVGDASAECKIRTRIRSSFTVKDSIITDSGQTSGKVKPDGTFAFARPNATFKGTMFVVRGTLKNGKGVGSWASGACARKLTFESVER